MRETSSTRQISIGPVKIGGGAPVSVQSMTNTDTRDVDATICQIKRLAKAGCEIIRVAVPDKPAALALRQIVAASPLPVIADIHFDWRLAVQSLENGVAALRINPGNIGSSVNVDRVVEAAKSHNAVIRIGVNGGSLQKDILHRHGSCSPQALVESALIHARYLEKRSFYDFKISIKSSSVPDTVEAYRMIATQCGYPLHLGITEAGLLRAGTIKSALGLGILLYEGIGDTMRVSLTADPAEEVAVAWEILSALNIRKRGPEIISCPTCGRTEIDLISLATAVQEALRNVTAPITVAVMGCVVNGPGEARQADIGIAGGRNRGIIFRKGKVIRSVNGQEELVKAFLAELELLIAEL